MLLLARSCAYLLMSRLNVGGVYFAAELHDLDHSGQSLFPVLVVVGLNSLLYPCTFACAQKARSDLGFKLLLRKATRRIETRCRQVHFLLP